MMPPWHEFVPPMRVPRGSGRGRARVTIIKHLDTEFSTHTLPRSLPPSLRLSLSLSHTPSPNLGPRQPCGDNYWTLIDAVTQHSSAKVVTTLGVPNVLSEDTSGIAAAVEMAKVTVFCGCVDRFDY